MTYMGDLDIPKIFPKNPLPQKRRNKGHSIFDKLQKIEMSSFIKYEQMKHSNSFA